MSTWVEYFKLPEKLSFSEEVVSKIYNMRPEVKSKIKMFGKEVEIPRLQKAYGRSYAFSGAVAEASEPIPEIFKNIKEFLDKRYNVNFNMMLINWYCDGNDYIGEHSDNEKQIKENTPIITVSLGAERDFVLKDIKTKKRKVYKLENNSVFTMGGTCQKTHKHSLPVRKLVKNYRISLTFRVFS